MVSKSKRGGIGAVGKAPARFFHPSEPIRARYTNPEEYKRAVLTGVTLISRARERLLKRRGGNEIDIYVVNIPGFDATFKVGVKHFSVTQEAEEPFEEERQTPPTAAPPAVPPPATDLPDETIELLSSTSDTAPVNADIVHAGRLALTAEDIIDLC